jgi:hypothetical protein
MDKNRARGTNQFSIYHDMSKQDREYKKLLKPYRDYALQRKHKAHIRGSKLIIDGEAWTLDELRERFANQVPTRVDMQEKQKNDTIEQPSINHKVVSTALISQGEQALHSSPRYVVTNTQTIQGTTERDDWPLPGPSSLQDTEHMEYDAVRAKRSYSNAVQSPPTTRKKSADLVKDITKKFDAIAGKAVDKSPPKRGKLSNIE